MNGEKKNNDNTGKKVENSSWIFDLGEFSRETGIRIEVLRRYISKQTRQMRNDAWEKLFPSIKNTGESDFVLPQRIGAPYRRHAELVEMFSDQKVLLDVFNCLPFAAQQATLRDWENKVDAAPSQYKSLSDDENRLMGIFLAMDAETRDRELLTLVQKGREHIASLR